MEFGRVGIGHEVLRDMVEQEVRERGITFDSLRNGVALRLTPALSHDEREAKAIYATVPPRLPLTIFEKARVVQRRALMSTQLHSIHCRRIDMERIDDVNRPMASSLGRVLRTTDRHKRGDE
jgi:hypothetical protein